MKEEEKKYVARASKVMIEGEEFTGDLSKIEKGKSVIMTFETALDFIVFSVSNLINNLNKKPDNDPLKAKFLNELIQMRDFFYTRITSIKIFPSPESPIPYRYDVAYRVIGDEKKEEVEQKIKEYLHSQIFNLILAKADPRVLELIKLKEEIKELDKETLELKKLLKEINKEKKKREVKNNLFKISIHTATQFYGDSKQLSIFSDEKIDAFSRATGLQITNKPDNYGVVLNQAQRKVFEGILKAFTDTNYKGDEQVDKATSLEGLYQNSVKAGEALVKAENAPYKNIGSIPVLKLTQAQIIKLSGHARTQGDKQDVIEALSFLATNQFCFYWLRLKTEKGKPVKDKNGDYVKEEVMEVGTLLRIKTVREQGILQYYEIHPSAPMLDQIESYFLLVPNNWRDEVKQLTGKKASSYTYELLLWLRLQYEQIRRYNKNGGKNRKPKPFKISKSWEDVAIALKMPESMYKANRKRASKIVQDAYSVAIKLGYLVKVENNGATDTLYLNEGYYPKTGELV